MNQVRLLTLDQFQCYPIQASYVGLVGPLLLGQTLHWFATLFEKNSPVLNNLKAFLVAFAEDLDL